MMNSMFNAWAHGSKNFLWWCGFDQRHLKFPPYEWSAWERELGLFDPKFNPKPVAGVMKAFHEFKAALPFDELPPFRRDAVCIVTRAQKSDDSLTNAWSAFLLAKQNHFDLRFSYVADELPDAPLYLLPGLNGADGIKVYIRVYTLYLVLIDDTHNCFLNCGCIGNIYFAITVCVTVICLFG